MTDYYLILGISRNATEDEIKTAFKKQALQYHPDKCKDNTSTEVPFDEKMKEINHAKDILLNPEKRRLYDMFGPNMSPNNGRSHPFQALFDMMNNFGATSAYNFNTQASTRNITIELPIDISDFFNNKEKNIEIKRNDPCNVCNGTGGASDMSPCNVCNGMGFCICIMQNGSNIIQQRMVCKNCNGAGQIIRTPCCKCLGSKTIVNSYVVKLTFPIGSSPSLPITINGSGNWCNGERGNTTLTFKLNDGSFTVVENYHLKTFVSLSLSESLCGFTKKILHPNGGEITLSNVNIIFEGDTHTLIGQGLQMENGQYGNLIVHYKVEKKELTDWQKNSIKSIL